MVQYTDALTDAVTTGGVLQTTAPVDLTDTLGAAVTTDQIMAYTAGTLDSAWLVENLVVDSATAVAVADAVGVGVALQMAWRMAVREQIRVTDNPAPQTTYNVLLADLGRIQTRLRAGYSLTAADTVTIATAAAYVSAYWFRDTISVNDLAAGAGRYGLSHADQIVVADTLARVIGGMLADGVDIADVPAIAARLAHAIAEAVTTGDNASASLLVQVITQEGVDITATDAAQMLYSGQLVDGVSVTAMGISPGNNVTTWALNTRTAALTEYQNYAFNSFARLGQRHLGASESGLYELTGDSDAGAAVVAALKTGMVQLGGSRFTSFKAAYLGVRGGGEFILKLEMGNGRVHHYRVMARDMETTKVKLGKGLRARYFSFELVSTGQDFDLDTIEFVPVVAQRRV